MSEKRTWASLRQPAEQPKRPPIDEKLHALFTSAAGTEVMNWLWQSFVVQQVPITADERAYREHEGKKRLILDLNSRIESVERERSSDKPGNWHRPEHPSGPGRG
jgi:hypothetical protein